MFRNPNGIVSDQGSAFTSVKFQQYCEDQGIRHQLVTTGIPRGNGQVELVNRTLIPLLVKLALPKPDE